MITSDIAESLDKSINYQGMIVERLNGNKLNEGFGEEDFHGRRI
jgi:hypothetical protein